VELRRYVLVVGLLAGCHRLVPPSTFVVCERVTFTISGSIRGLEGGTDNISGSGVLAEFANDVQFGRNTVTWRAATHSGGTPIDGAWASGPWSRSGDERAFHAQGKSSDLYRVAVGGRIRQDCTAEGTWKVVDDERQTIMGQGRWSTP
jgi:hypothetical protein